MSDSVQQEPVKSIARPPDRRGSVDSISKHRFHRIAYVEWGDPAASHVAICVHGLTRQGRDFDLLAAALADRGWRVMCPDLVGRGQSDWLRHHEEYALPQYAMDMTTLIARSGVERVSWIGTSLGGLVGIFMAGQEHSPIQRLVINDIGPFVPWQAMMRTGNDIRNAPTSFPDYASAVAIYRKVLAPFGNLSDREWDHLVRHSIGRDPDGRWRALCDPGIAAVFRPVFFYNLSLWSYWDAIACPTLVLRGAQSDLLLPSTAHEMTRRGPRTELVAFADCGHAPALLDRDQITVVAGWLDNS